LAQGKKQAEVAETLNVSTPTVCRFAKRDDVREMITQETQRFAELLPNAVTMTRDLIEAGKKEAAKVAAGDEADLKILEMALKEGEAIRKSTGITPTHTGTTLIHNILIGPPVGLSPIIAKLLAATVAGNGNTVTLDHADKD
jgi:hypothetical protein